jgi:asparagine synthase (glutamine-hydrolysing)
MCGIFALLNNDNVFNAKTVIEQFEKGKNRGPEFSKLTQIMIKAQFGFHRLAINGLNDYSNQPLCDEEIAVICNGEIYNYKELYDMMDIERNTDSDCEVILHLYRNYGIEQTLQMLDGVFSFILIDYRIHNKTSKIYVARDPYGVRPLYVLKPSFIDRNEDNKHNIYAFASEMKVLSEFHKEIDDLCNNPLNNNRHKPHVIEHFEPGTYSEYEITDKVSANWHLIKDKIRYHSTGFKSILNSHIYDMNNIITDIQNNLKNAVHKRCVTTERPIACLLSGGLDSSLITALVCEYHKANNLPIIETYSIGLEGSVDLKYAKIVANYLGTKHTEIVLTEENFVNAIPDVIRSIESYDTTSVRASIGNWLLGKYISENSDAKVIFNGDGSDELTGGYLYMHKAPDIIEFDKECRRLLKDIHAFDVLRSDKCISSHGLEPRTPFLDRGWVQYYLSLPLHVRCHTNNNNCEKYLLRKAFSGENYITYNNQPLLPNEVLWRRKEAFSDGVTQKTRSLYEIIQEYTDKKINEEYGDIIANMKTNDVWKTLCNTLPVMKGVGEHLLPKTSEQFYYRRIFEEAYPVLGKIVPYFWMPKYVDATDASARTLELYNDTNEE